MNCVYEKCRAVNLCKNGYCVGAELEKNGYEIRDGQLHHKLIPTNTDDEQWERATTSSQPDSRAG